MPTEEACKQLMLLRHLRLEERSVIRSRCWCDWTGLHHTPCPSV